ncbi:hypothetical protein [Sedimentibacter sp.]|uniref:hypothetical protein n=1 Tax=Sedimentibacter sp. TaxID=1960295 RepID=UPI0028AB1AF1|nr:hypothetical protein [Sedimentibacter sp.]
MKKVCGIFLIIMLVAFMTACGNTSISENEDTVDSSGNALPENFVMLDAEEWPDNEYTANIPQPESGTLLRGWIDLDKEYCHLELFDMTQSDSEQYVKTLKESGFSEVDKVSEEINDDYISVGTLLTKDSTTISISYIDDLFGMYIKNEQ